MHMSDALISAQVGGAFWAVSGSMAGYSLKKVREEASSSQTNLMMGVLGAFVFSAQMMNFSVPLTGSSGHIGGGILLAALLGPFRAFLAMAAILSVQCLFFSDGGILALGCNVFNLAFFPCFVAYPLIFKLISNAKSGTSNAFRLGAATVIAATASLLMGAFSVAVQTTLSGNSALSFAHFLMFMLPIHLAIGIVEGLGTWLAIEIAVGSRSFCPDFCVSTSSKTSFALPASIGIASLLTGGFLSSFASSSPDGLEWSIAKTCGSEEGASLFSDHLHAFLARTQEFVSILPDYSFEGFSGSLSVLANPAAGIAGAIIVFLISMAVASIPKKSANAGSVSA